MRFRDLAPFLPIALLVFAPLACSSTSSSGDTGGGGDDAGDQGDDGGDQTDDGGTTNKDGSTGPFTPGAHPGYPQVPDNGGAIISNMKLYVIIPSNETLPVTSFGTAFLASSVWTGVASEYGLGTAVTPVTIAGSAITGSQDQSTIQNYIEANISGGQAPNGHSMYILFLPSAANLDNDPGCEQTGVGGYHVPFGGSGDGWGVVQHCSAAIRQTMGETQWATIAASHEVVEAATDVDGQHGYALPQPDPSNPVPYSIWDDVLLTEIGDLCVGSEITEGSFTYQRMWSNKAAKTGADPCAPSITPYFNTGATGGDTNGWFSTKSGSAAITIEGFSTAAMDPWPIQVVVAKSSGGAAWDGALATKTKTGGFNYIANGEKGTLTVTAPSGAQSGDWAEIELVSQSPTATTGESYHIWPIGVYVP